ncbi:TetR/AcrR family transcriptional regulator [Parashewanella spongiae]|uniref:TetR/AcrR family transcriptional regulator n=1 Tax=Parashewanella spongiae TaxID=342950 RepID=A0A3A6U9D6_9GAMM|nr:TetR family transcriptional regulator [Parashewanella spongiae]MCL1077656.1 TetR/AcrR family transcriptional regulator [Parashewanella spongiae]RJY18117.1 TetR/AcrR family transcriptional regulator [Parashewanella spongiae]
MAKRSKSQTELTINQIMDEALKQILTIGFDAMSYTTLSEATGISRTGISHHFPKKTDFLLKLDDRIGSMFIDSLDFSSVEQLKSSWKAALEKPKYKATLKLFFNLCGNKPEHFNRFKAISDTHENALTSLGKTGEDTIYDLIGYSALYLFQAD